jgi:hypothetical protein
MSEVKTLVTLVLGGMFDHRELGDIDTLYEAPACEQLQRELVNSIEDVHVELVSRLDYDAKCHSADVCFGLWKRTEEERDAAQADLSALREELSASHQREARLQDMVTAAEQRNAELVEIITEVAKQAGDHHMSHQTWNLKTHLTNIHQKLEAALNPTESGASECGLVK